MKKENKLEELMQRGKGRSWKDVDPSFWERKFQEKAKEDKRLDAHSASLGTKDFEKELRELDYPTTTIIDSPEEEAIKSSKIIADTRIGLDTYAPYELSDIPSLESQFFREGVEIFGFKVGKKLAEGGMGGIFSLIQEDKTYILKMPLTEGGQKNALNDEAEVLNFVQDNIKAQIKSGKLKYEPNIIKLLVSSCGYLTYLVLEPLDDQVDHKKSASERITKALLHPKDQVQGQNPVRVAKYIWDVAKSLEFLHSINVVHRDIKYQNCMDTRRNGKLEMILFDFGLAKILTDENEPNLRKLTNMGGTLPYTTKEFIKEMMKYEKSIYADAPLSQMRLVLKKADWDALAFSAYDLLTGASPYSYTNSLPEYGVYQTIFDDNQNVIKKMLNFKGDELDEKLVQKCQYGKMFVKVFKMLRDPDILLTEKRDQMYRLIQRKMKQPHIFK